MSNFRTGLTVVGVVLLVSTFIGALMFGIPKYRVWQRELSGQAALAEASWDRRIEIEEAEATKEAAKLLDERDSIQALGVAAANRILGQSLQDNEAYLRYLWIIGLSDGNSEVIYVPTEANLPLLEATRGVR